MDKLTAYQVLGLDSNASIDEVKEAYARLSKEYHPEENPEEFQQIHEAYVSLTRGGRRANRTMAVEASPIEKQVAPEVKESDLVFRNVQKVEEEPVEEDQAPELSFGRSLKEAEKAQEVEEQAQSDFNFDASIKQAQKQEEELFKQNIQKCVNELEVLFTPPNCNELKRFKEFFGRKEYEKVFFSRPFIYYLAQYINQVELKYEVYSYIIKFYGLKNKKVEELIPEAQQLYKVIDSRYSVTHDAVAAKRRGMFGGAFGGILYALFKFGPKMFKNMINQNANGNEVNFLVFVPVIIIGLIVYVIYKGYCKKYDIYVAMKKSAGWLFILSLPALIFDIWQPFFYNNPSNSMDFAVITTIIGVMWWITMKLVIFILKKKREKNDQK